MQFFARGVRTGEQRGHVTQLGEERLERKVVLRGENFGWREDGALVSVFEGDDAGFRGDNGFAAADVALQEAVHGARQLHVIGDFFEHALLSVSGLEGEDGFNLLAHTVGDLEGDSGHHAGFAALEGEAAFEPEKFL